MRIVSQHGIMISTPMVNTNTTPPVLDSLPDCVPEAFRTGLIDTGIIIKVAIPYKANVYRHFPAANDLGWVTNDIPGSNRQPFFGLLVDPFINHDLRGEFSPLTFPNPSWVSVNNDLTAHPYGLEHPLVRMAPSFTGWRGSLNYLVTVTSSMIVQGELSLIRGRYVGNGPYKYKFPQLEFDEVDNNQIVNLTSERRVLKEFCFNANTKFVNMMHYWQSLVTTETPNLKPMHAARDFFFIRPNTDITTFSPEGGFLSFKIFLEPGPDFEFLYPSIPRRMDLIRGITSIDKRFPFVVRETLIVSQREVIAGALTLRNLEIEDSKYDETIVISSSPPTVTRTFAYPLPIGFIDGHKYDEVLAPRWFPITGYSYGRSEPGSPNFQLSVVMEGATILLFTRPVADLVLGEVLFEVGYNTSPYYNTEPPFYYP
nr:MAG: putative capsid protein 3 [Myotis brandtii picorna-like virus 1]